MRIRLKYFLAISIFDVFIVAIIWIYGSIPFLYMAPVLIFLSILLSFRCSNCERMIFQRKFGVFVFGFPIPPKRCNFCGEAIRS